MVITILEARVSLEKSILLEETYSESIKQLDPGITQTFLTHSIKDPNVWQIVTVWRDRDALDAMRRSGETPRGVQMFHAAGAEPLLSVFDVTAHGQASHEGLIR